MAKPKKVFYCQNCGARHSQWMGQCPVCKQWNTIVEETLSRQEAKKAGPAKPKPVRSIPLSQVTGQTERRISTADPELDTVLGGGLVPGSVILLGGEPGIGKSTLLLQAALRMPYKVLYVSGEESPAQIKLRADRLSPGQPNPNLLLLPETNTQKIFRELEQHLPDLLIVDSIQTLHTDYIDSSPGSVSQIRETAAELIRYAKHTATPVFLIGHITKEGIIAGPKVLEHMVDTVLQFEGDRYHRFRILRALKNRFGSTNEMGLYEMTVHGLKPVENPSGLLPDTLSEAAGGTAVGLVNEGIRSFAVETQALVSPSVYGTPQRSVTGYDLKRLHMILAVLEKRAGLRMLQNDVFLNIAGGLRIMDPALDLAVAAALISSYENMPVPSYTGFAGEIGLTGEVRPVAHMDRRLAEAEKTGLQRVYLSKHQKITYQGKLELVPIGQISGLLGMFPG